MDKVARVLVLLVDDEAIVRFVATDDLKDAGYDVIEAASASEALAILQARSDVGVLFTDVNMPGDLDGLGLAELVHDRWPDIKLVVTSGRPLTRKVPDDGRFLSKPYTAQQMTACLRDAQGV